MPTINATYQKAHQEYRRAISESAAQCQADIAAGSGIAHTINLHRARVRSSWILYQQKVPAWARTELR